MQEGGIIMTKIERRGDKLSVPQNRPPRPPSTAHKILLNRAVIFRMMRDLARGTENQKLEAVRWFFDTADFIQCCKGARMSPVTLRTIVERMVKMDTAGRIAYLAHIESTAKQIRERMAAKRKEDRRVRQVVSGDEGEGGE